MKNFNRFFGGIFFFILLRSLLKESAACYPHPRMSLLIHNKTITSDSNWKNLSSESEKYWFQFYRDKLLQEIKKIPFTDQ